MQERRGPSRGGLVFTVFRNTLAANGSERFQRTAQAMVHRISANAGSFGQLSNRINLSVSHEALNISFGMSLIAFGYLSSAFNWTYALMQMPAGVLLDRLGVRGVGRVSTLLWSLASFDGALAPVSLCSHFAETKAGRWRPPIESHSCDCR
jgi:Major Facilitator Superfamily